ncbi:small integral membrane protein 33 [Rhineura floridana]|uniref:small integral membrane protein 33 n=1 Tax=Rhineura floridana TaxID=261503 RepID=UPI002AC7E7F2|nr:small integral membrane protein 33 [Rhineura floridana]
MNFSVANNHLRQYDDQSFVDFTPGSVTRKGDSLAMIFIIVAVFVLLAIVIIVTVHYGPQLRAIQITLYHEPMPQDLDNGIQLIYWRKQGLHRKCSLQSALTLENDHASGLNTQCGREEPNIIEITYL